ncbi:lipid droplet-regulating VLDL assembly factor AUP1-like [Schistocerca cancellata]|uniref:lipid droplet-regulating VLDL assembly factor AUP1-like n=1 Tax=Schistocerca cancellata TaxID=274614 RepID=UPI00211928CE|nr:lipid droplet-regulating VLDL assembly factor AUP1-like [Schistocerca cancellata]
MEVKELFRESRYPSGLSALLLSIYSPFGLLLAVLRFLFGLQLILTSRLLPQLSIAKSKAFHIVCPLLGLLVSHENKEAKDTTSRVFVANHVTRWDALIFHLTLGCLTKPKDWGLPLWVNDLLGIKDDMVDERHQDSDSGTGAVLLLPEGTTTSGTKGLLKFAPCEFSAVQPVAVKIKRPAFADVAPTLLSSSTWADLFWFLFTPYTMYTLIFLPVMRREEDEDDSAFAKRLQTEIAAALGLSATTCTAADKAEWAKRRAAELRRQAAAARRALAQGTSSDLQRMVRQVAEVLPRVPHEAILRDLMRTRSVDITISNILEGQVRYDPLPESLSPLSSTLITSIPSGASQSTSSESCPPCFPKSAQERMQSFHERKARLIENARQKYIEKHGLKMGLNC